MEEPERANHKLNKHCEINQLVMAAEYLTERKYIHLQFPFYRVKLLEQRAQKKGAKQRFPLYSKSLSHWLKIMASVQASSWAGAVGGNGPIIQLQVN